MEEGFLVDGLVLLVGMLLFRESGGRTEGGTVEEASVDGEVL